MKLNLRYTKNELRIFFLILFSFWELVLPQINLPILGETSFLKLFVLLGVVLYLPVYPFGDKKASKILLGLVIFYIYGVFTLFWTSTRYYAINRLINYFVSLALVLELMCLIRNEHDFRFALNCIYRFSLIVLIISVIEIGTNSYLLYGREDIFHSTYGLIIPLANQRGPNELAGELITLFPFCLLYRQFFLQKSNNKFLWILFTIIIVLIDSRSGILGFALIILCSFLWSDKSNLVKVLLISILALIVIAIMFFGISDFDTSFFQDSSRMLIWQNYLSKLFASKFKGIGLGVVGTYGLTGRYSMIEGSIHNFFLEIGVETGIIGFVSLFSVFIFMVKESYKCFKYNRSSVEKTIILFCITYMLAAIGSSSIRAINNIWLLWGVSLAWLINVNKVENFDSEDMVKGENI